MKVDPHVHSTFSCDGKATLDELGEAGPPAERERAPAPLRERGIDG